MDGSPMPVGSSMADDRKFRRCLALPLVEYTSAVLLNTSRPNSPRQFQLASSLFHVALLWSPMLKLGLAFPMMPSSEPVGEKVSPLTQPTLPVLHANTCRPVPSTRRNVAPQKVPSGCPGMRRCAKRPDCPCPDTAPVMMKSRPAPRFSTEFRSTDATIPDESDRDP